MRTALAAVGALLFLAAPACPQPAFESATVAVSKSATARDAQMQVLPGGKVVIKNVPLLMIVAAAWNVPFQSPRLTGGREWTQLREGRYDIDATPGKDAIPPDLSAKERGDRIRPMMQSLLEDRFSLKMRTEAKEQPVYALVIANGGVNLEKSKFREKDCANVPSVCHRVGGGKASGIHGEAIDMDDVALFVQNWTDRPVIDKTGLTDLYNIQTEAWPEGDGRSLADIFRQLGIIMEARRAVVDMFIIEHVQPPAAN